MVDPGRPASGKQGMLAMDPVRRYAFITGVLFLITFIASIPAAFIFYEPVLKHSGYILGDGADTRIATGALCELIVVIANIGTATALFPVLRRQNEGLALSYVTARVIESTFIIIGILSLMTLVTLRQEAPNGNPDGLRLAGESLVALHDWTFVLGPGFIVGIGNGLILGYLMYRSELVPRRMAVLGLVGGPLIIISGVAVLFGWIEAGGVGQAVATIPEFFWELFLGIYLTARGFRRSAVSKLYGASPHSDRDTPRHSMT